MTDPSHDDSTTPAASQPTAAHGGHAEHDLSDPGPPGEKPGLKQQELRDAAEEGPHGSHDDARRGPVEHARRGNDGHKPGHGEMGHDHHAMMVADFRRRFWVSLVLSVPVLLLSPAIQAFLRLGDALRFPGDALVVFALSTVVFFYGGWPFLKGFVSEVKGGRPGMMTLISVAITTAYVYSTAVVFGLEGMPFFWELVTLIDVMLLGHWVEMKSVMGASKALEELARLMPSEAHKLMPDGTVQDVPLDQLQHGDRVIVKPAEKVPADGVVVDGQTSVNESMLTGESVPVSKTEGSAVIGGSINGEGAVTVEVQKTGAESFLSQVIDLVREAQESKSKTQDLANRAALWLTVVALGGGALTLFFWSLVMGEGFAFAIERAVTVMVIACPHALGLAIPLVVAVSTAISARNGLLIRDRTAFEAARNLQAVIFDKTGTLTEGRFGITDTLVFDQTLTEEAVLRFAAAVEALSEHPIAQGIAAAVERPLPVEGFRAIPGKGAEGTVEGRRVQVVSPGYVRAQGLAIDDPRYETLSAQGKTVVFVLLDGHLAGAFALADVIRPEAKGAIADLKAMGIQTMMLTGDNRKVAAWVAEEIGLDDVFAEVLPEQKSDKVKEVQARGLAVAMTGDGVNDAPALAQADVGIAIGAGTDVAVETADIILVRSNPQDVATIVKLSRATYRKMIQNLWWAAGYNIVAIPLAAGVLYSAGVLLGPAMGAVFMSASTVIVAINARLLKIER
ncbi:MAG: copper-translocating P-type ATPase [Rhodothermaceae bacterium]|nr:copper-translocating P-type ATPase [Rhodothermaceae bacterium]